MIQDLWIGRDGQPTKRNGVGKRYRVHNVGWPSTSCRTKDEAEMVNARRLLEGKPRTSVETVKDAVDVWERGKAGLSPKGRDAVHLAASYVVERWGPYKVTELEMREVQAWLAGLETSRGPASTSLKGKVLQCLKGAVGDGADTTGLRVPKQRRREPVFLDARQLRALAEQCGRYKSMLMLLGTTGLRVSECCRLDVMDVYPKKGRLRVHIAKSQEGRDVPVSPSVMAMLDLKRSGSAPLFTNTRGGRVDSDDWRARVFRPATIKVRVPEMRIHDLRHTAASLAIASGADVKAVQRMLGHKSAAMTLDLYGHLFDQGLDDVAARMDAVLNG